MRVVGHIIAWRVCVSMNTSAPPMTYAVTITRLRTCPEQCMIFTGIGTAIAGCCTSALTMLLLEVFFKCIRIDLGRFLRFVKSVSITFMSALVDEVKRVGMRGSGGAEADEAAAAPPPCHSSARRQF